MLAYPNADLTLSEPSVASEGHGWGLEADAASRVLFRRFGRLLAQPARR
jgi:hypothetical protein